MKAAKTLGAVAFAFALLPFIMPGGSLDLNPFAGGRFPLHAGFVDLGTTILVFALFALGFNLLFGHMGELSFGHAMFFTLGAYVTGLYSNGFDTKIFGISMHHEPANNLWLALLLALAAAALWSWFLARLIVPRSSGIYYSMITLAFAQVVFFITYKWSDFTGGEDGIQAIARPNLPGLPAGWLSNNALHFFIFTAIVTLLAVAAMYWLLESPFGSVLHAIRENKQRARFLGYDVDKFRVNAFVLSALFPALAGWLWVFYQQSINPDAGSVDYSGRVVMMSLLGGINTFVGPMFGAFVYWELQNNFAHLTKYWEGVIGLVFAFFVLVAPRGIWGALEDVQHTGLRSVRRRLRGAGPPGSIDVPKEATP
jgi:branched-chain amino acid transport system permease protein